MKKVVFSFICILLSACMFAQEKYAVPSRTSDQKHQRTLFQLWIAGFGGGINFAKAQGKTPYEYGAYLGKLFAPGWGEPGNFDGLIRGSLLNFEDCRVAEDPALLVKENPDGSVTITTGEQMIHKYFPEGNSIVSFTDYVECVKGVFSEIGGYLGAKVNIEVKDGQMIYTYTRRVK